MTILHFTLDDKKYTLEFLGENQAKIQQENKNKCIVVHYFSDTKVRDFVNYIKSLDFSKTT